MPLGTSQENVRFFSFFLLKILIFVLILSFLRSNGISLWQFLHSTLYTINSTLITHSLYLKLSFPSLICSFKSPCKIPRKNQGRTYERPKNPKIQKVRFINITISFPFLIPCLIPPREPRETTERRAHQLPVKKKFCFLRLRPYKIVLIPKKVDSHPKKVDSFPETIDLPVFLEKITSKAIFLAYLEKKVYLCAKISKT